MKLTKKDEIRFWSKVQIGSNDDCWPWKACISSSGYGTFVVQCKAQQAHRVAYTIVNGEIPACTIYRYMCICHKCDNKICCNPNHLFLGTIQDNVSDRDAKGRTRVGHIKGEKHGQSKLTNEQVIEIRSNLKMTGKYFAEKFNISTSVVSEIRSCKAWKHIDSGDK